MDGLFCVVGTISEKKAHRNPPIQLMKKLYQENRKLRSESDESPPKPSFLFAPLGAKKERI